MAILRLINESELRLGGIIGRGNFGTVYKVIVIKFIFVVFISTSNLTLIQMKYNFIDVKLLSLYFCYNNLYLRNLADILTIEQKCTKRNDKELIFLFDFKAKIFVLFTVLGLMDSRK